MCQGCTSEISHGFLNFFCSVGFKDLYLSELVLSKSFAYVDLIVDSLKLKYQHAIVWPSFSCNYLFNFIFNR